VAIEVTPPPPKKPKDMSRDRPNSPKNFAKLSPEERKANSVKAIKCRKNKTGRTPGNAPNWTNRDYAPVRERAKADALRMYAIMETDGSLPEDPIAREAVKAILQLLREPSSKSDKLKEAKTLLEYFMPKPTQKQDITMRSAEDFLTELADEADDGE